MNTRKLWDEESTQQLIAMYQDKNLAIEKIARHLDRTPRSIIAKLVQLKIYKKPYTHKEKVTLKMLVRELEKILEINIEGLNLSRKSNLQAVVDAISKRNKNKPLLIEHKPTLPLLAIENSKVDATRNDQE